MKYFQFYYKNDPKKEIVYSVMAKDDNSAWNFFKEVKDLPHRDLRLLFSILEY